MQGGEVTRPTLEQLGKLGQGLLGLAQSSRQEVGDLELQPDLSRPIVGVQQLLAQQRDEATPVLVAPQQRAQAVQARQVVVDRFEGGLEARLGLVDVAQRFGELARAMQQLGATPGALRQRNLLVGDLEQVLVAARSRQQPRQQLDRRQVMGVVLEACREELDRFGRVVVARVQLAEHRQQERAAGLGLGPLELLGVEGSQCLGVAELVKQALETVTGGAVARVRGDGGLVALAGSFELVEALLHDPTRAQVRHRHLFRGQPGGTGVGDLELDQLEQLGPHAIGVEKAAGVLDRGDVARHHAKCPTHRGEAVDGAVESEQGESPDAIEELGSSGGIVGLADRFELAQARLHRDLPPARGRRKLLEAAPQARIVGLGRRGGAQQLERSGAFLVLAQRDAGAGQGHRPALGGARLRLRLERLQHELRVAGHLRDPE